MVFGTRRAWARGILFLTGMRIRKTGKSSLEKNGAAIYCSNHTSYLDIIVLLAALPGKIIFMGKAELLKVPMLGAFFRYIDIPVDRSDRRKSANAFRSAKQLLETGHSIVIFPEGGIMGDAPRLHPFKEGAFSMAVYTQKPVVPLTLPDSWKALPEGKKIAVPRKIRIILHEALMPEITGKSAGPKLAGEVYRRLEADISKYAYEN